MDFSNQIILSEKNLPVGSSSGSCSNLGSRSDAGSETVVGFDGEARKLVEQLMGEKKQLQIVSIVGMPGLGKTTLARKVYNDPSIVYHFYVRAWTYVAQVPRKRDLLLGLLRSGFDYRDEVSSDEKLSEMLKKRLSGQRYLIVMDDIWGIRAWNEMRLCFPDNKNGSRIIFTSRLAEVPQQVQTKSYQHHLPLLTDAESWDLLQTKVFQKEKCPPWLVEIGRYITKKCQGLPLAIVVISGLLAKDMSPNWWSKVAKDMSSYADGDSKQYMDTLALSYNHLPPHLKPCFLYFGGFPEDYEIPVWKLILLWVAEGFIHKIGENNLEDIAAGFLKDLIHRSLVIVAKRSSDGGIKACIVHDLLRDLCLTKAHEENFLQQFERYKPYINSVSPLETLFRNFMPRPLCIHSPNSFRVLDLSSMVIPTFPKEIVQLEDLRFISLRTRKGSIPTSISNLQYLETLIVELQEEGVIVPKNIWKIKNLRHLVLQQGGLVAFEDPCFKEAESYELKNLETIKSLNPSSKFSDQILERTPNLRKLVFSGNPFQFSMTPLNLGKLNRLQKLKLVTTSFPGRENWESFRLKKASYCLVFSPVTLKKLTLIGTLQVPKEMENIGMLPNLEVLKLINVTFMREYWRTSDGERWKTSDGERWKTSDGGFPRLKYLKLESLGILHWRTSSKHFPNLEHLKLDNCWRLEEIPLGLGDIYTLEIIELSNCYPNVVQSAYDIKEDQETKGNDLLKILVHRTKLVRVKSQYNLLDLLK